MLNRPRDLLGVGFYPLVHPIFREIKAFLLTPICAKPDEQNESRCKWSEEGKL